ncbi:endomucin isoform X2 [Pongo pygmaeus]|uniref:EMCN isoform 8 n=1 Tax=Pongo abelii TaxID=9601 RepID=A0A2J8TQK6_PONAB|nr:endomucin isoform X2 [Pongo pygmaeus]PNJ35273.1 EMCN isoform 8 [Pongo abelii]
MELLQVTILFLLPSICSSNSTGVLEAANNSLVVTTIKTSITTPNTESLQKNVITPTTGTTPKGKITNELLKMSLMSAVTLTSKDEGLKVTTTDVRKNESIVSNVTVTIVTLPNAVSTLQSSKPKSSILQPDASPSETGTLSSIPVTIPENTSQSQVIGTEGGKNASTSATSRSYSSIILPVVIALIVITLSVFVLVGLYRMCWKADPGTPENGNDQPQSDKESVKLLTVKTISHESGEHSAQGKTKN